MDLILLPFPGKAFTLKAKAVLATLVLNFICLSSFAQLPLVYSAENTGASCAAPPLPSFAQLPAIEPLPDPFRWADGRGRTTDFKDWECRRNEIKAQIENYEIGRRPSRPQDIKATYTPGATAGTGTLTVVVTVNGKSLTLNSQVSLPTTGSGPFPAIIGMNSLSGSVQAAVFTSRNVARITYSHNNVTTYGNPSLNDPYYQLYPDQNLENSGQYAAWSWGVSRLIDGLELVQASLPIDLKHLGVTGCSYAGKMALFSGAMDERIALTIAQESGGGGAPAWRVSETLGGVEKLGATDYRWFKDDMKQFENTNVAKLPHDHHELMAMIAPRALLVTGNTDFEWLANPSAYVSARAAHEVWKQFGIGDRFGFYIDGGHNHCAIPASQQPAVEAFVDRFLLGNLSANTNITVHPYPNLDYQRWYKWWGTNTPVLPPLPPEPLGKRIWLEAECATVGANWEVVADTSAAHGAYVKAKTGMSSTAAAPTAPAAYLTMPFTIDSAATYSLLAWLNVPAGEDYSYWMKLDNEPFQPVSSQLLANPGFENGRTGWTTLNGGGATITANTVAAEAHTGSSSLKVVNPRPGAQWQVQVSSAAFPTTIGKRYTISYWVRAAAPGGSIRLSTGPSGAQYQGDQAIGTAWQQVSWTITATLASTTFLFDMGQAANTYYIDDASVKEVSAEGWRWVKLREAALGVGPHTLTVAYNAGGNAKLDKLLVTTTKATITGKGADADNCKTQQTISFGALPAALVGDRDLTLTATASSGLPITYTSSDTTVATVTNGVVRIRKAGTTTITARQAGNATYAAAPAVSQTLTVAPLRLQVQYKDGDDSRPHGQLIKPTLRLDNLGQAGVAYNELTIRYWLTPENYSGLATNVDWAALGASNIRTRYVELPKPHHDAYGYVEYSFAASLGQLAGGSSSGEIRSRFHNNAYGDLGESTDWSYRYNSWNYAPNERITVYRNGRLVWGNEPEVIDSIMAFEVLSQNRNGYSRGNTISTYFNVQNVGNVPVDYPALRVRYWFSPDGSDNINHWFDWAQVGTNNVGGVVGQQGNQLYFEVGFGLNLGKLYPLSSTGDVRFRLAKKDWTNFVEDNDWSYRAPWEYTYNDHMTLYYKGQLVYGAEPGTRSAAARTANATAPGAAAPSDGADQGTSLESFPNPVASTATVQFRAAEAGRALVQLYNPLGQLVATLYNDTVENGRAYQLPLAAQRLANGLYECRLVLAGKTLTRRIAISH